MASPSRSQSKTLEFSECLNPSARETTRSPSASVSKASEIPEHPKPRDRSISPSKAPIISERTSSKGFTKRKANDDLISERSKLSSDLRESRRKLKVHGSFDSDYWVGRTEVAEMQVEHTKIHRKISIRDFSETYGGDEQDWLNTPQAKQLLEEERCHALDKSICATQAERLKIQPGDKLKSMRRAFMQLFTSAKIGLNITTGMGRRETSEQSNFRENLIKCSNARHPMSLSNKLWCPISNEWIFNEHATAAHIFSYCHGQPLMDAIFGRINEDEPELFSPKNGILMSTRAEAKWDKGDFVIVPFLTDDASKDEVQGWHKQEPKRYMIRVINPKGHLMDSPINLSSDRTWNDLDGQEVIFRNDFRPRARYLYFKYCVTMLRRSWIDKKPTVALNDQIGKQWWGTPGRFMHKNMVLAFVEEMGHEYEALLEGAMEANGSEDDVPVETALAASNDEIRLSWRKEDESFTYALDTDSDD